jgi:phosphate transport system substrate-binding protein
VRDGTYPLYRPLFLYTRGAPRGVAADLVRFALSPAGQDIVQAVGFVRLEKALPPPELADGGSGEESKPTRPPLRIFFPFGTGRVSEEGRLKLAALAASVAHSGERLIVIGHADGRGHPAGNRRASQVRAELVAAQLRIEGIDGERIEVKGAGGEAPIASNETRMGRERNRRVDVYVVRDGTDVAKSR